MDYISDVYFRHPSFIGWTCTVLFVNSMLNYWLIHSRLVSFFRYVLLTRIIGSLIIAMPGILFTSLNYSSPIFTYDFTFLITIPLSLGSLTLNKTRKRSFSDKKNYTYLFFHYSSLPLNVLETFSWTLYLLPYEYLLRGQLLSYHLNKYDPIIAILLNSGLYALSHIQQGKRETLGAFVLGILLCCLTILTGNFLSAFLIHLSLALSNSYFTMKSNRLSLIKI